MSGKVVDVSLIIICAVASALTSPLVGVSWHQRGHSGVNQGGALSDSKQSARFNFAHTPLPSPYLEQFLGLFCVRANYGEAPFPHFDA